MEAHNAEQIVAEVTENVEDGCGIGELRDIHDIVHEDEDYVVFADARGYELTELGQEHEAGYDAVEKAMHTMAGELCDYNWSTVWPVVVEK